MKQFLSRIGEQHPESARAISESKLIFCLRTRDPATQIYLNGRKNPPQIIYGSSTLRPDLEIELTADALHAILLGELRLGKALANGQLKVRGPVWKSLVLEQVFHDGQAIYSQAIQESGVDRTVKP